MMRGKSLHRGFSLRQYVEEICKYLGCDPYSNPLDTDGFQNNYFVDSVEDWST
jgi:hypothetical protein